MEFQRGVHLHLRADVVDVGLLLDGLRGVADGVVHGGLRRRGEGLGETFTVRKISNGLGVERIFPVNAPVVSKVELVKSAHVRQSRLYFLRNVRGKAARLKERRRHVRD